MAETKISFIPFTLHLIGAILLIRDKIMFTLEELASDETIKSEYKKSLLLNIFKKLVVMMNRDDTLRLKIRKLFLQTTDAVMTTQIIISKYFNFDLSAEDSRLMYKWLNAHFNKQPTRKPVPLNLKIKLYQLQNGKCAVCGEDLGEDWSEIHVDHIIPWMLVGDELADNYQCLCQTCNECKSAHTDYIFKKLINLN